MDDANRNILWCHALLDGLAVAGVRQVVLSPGARSTPLALVALRHPALTTRVVLDERSAAFMALGLAKGSGEPTVVIATSGTAIANWHPAVIEADQSRIPLILLSADRPPELQGCGANQTIDQVKIFGAALRAFHALAPAEDDSRWLRSLALRVVSEASSGPVQVNVALREPLVPLPGSLRDTHVPETGTERSVWVDQRRECTPPLPLAGEGRGEGGYGRRAHESSCLRPDGGSPSPSPLRGSPPSPASGRGQGCIGLNWRKFP